MSVQKEAGCVVGTDYPHRICDHAVVSKANMERMKRAYALGAAGGSLPPRLPPPSSGSAGEEVVGARAGAAGAGGGGSGGGGGCGGGSDAKTKAVAKGDGSLKRPRQATLTETAGSTDGASRRPSKK